MWMRREDCNGSLKSHCDISKVSSMMPDPLQRPRLSCFEPVQAASQSIEFASVKTHGVLWVWV